MTLLDFFGYCFIPSMCFFMTFVFVIWYAKDNS